MLNFNLSIMSKKEKSKPNNSAQKSGDFNYLFLGTIILSFAGVSFGNFLVDPSDIFRHNQPFNLTLNKTEKNNYDRLYQTIDVINIKPERIIIGSSRVKQGVVIPM